MTAALEGGESSAARPGRTLAPRKTRFLLHRRLGGPQGRSVWAENLTPPGFDPPTVQPIGSRYTDWATRPTQFSGNLSKNINNNESFVFTWHNVYNSLF